MGPRRSYCTAYLSTWHYTRLVNKWITGIGLRLEEYGTHWLCRTKASIIFKATDNLWVV